MTGYEFPVLRQCKTLPAMLKKLMTTMTRILAESDNYKVTSEYEYVTLHFKDQISRKSIYIGDFYGDPDCAIISMNEKYVVTAGCGLIIYKLQEPFNEFSNHKNPDQYIEFFREPTNIWWVKDLYQSDLDQSKYFRSL